MTTTRRIFSLCLALALTTFACEGEKPPTDKANTEAAPDTAAAPTPAPADAESTGADKPDTAPTTTTPPPTPGDTLTYVPVKATVAMHFVAGEGGTETAAFFGDETYMLDAAVLEGAIEGAAVAPDPVQEDTEVVHLKLTPDGTAAFAKLTGENIGRELAVVINGKVVTAPTIQEAISGGRVQLSPGTEDNPDYAQKLFEALTQ